MKTCEYIFNETLHFTLTETLRLCICYYSYDVLRFGLLLLSLLGNLLGSC